jgi:membrane-bound lytic murein transglycosylase B
VLAVLLAAGVAMGAIAVVAQDRHDDVEPGRALPRTPLERTLPAPSEALPRSAAMLAAALTGTTRRLNAGLGIWDPAGAAPREVTYLALYQQRLLRLMAAQRALGDAALASLPGDVRGFARDTVLGQRSLAAIPRSPGRAPTVRVAAPAPAADLRRDYAVAERRSGVPWSILASVNFVESAFGRVRSASEAGAKGPMQFLPATWRKYGMGGDIEDPRDAILAAANYLHRAGAPAHLGRSLFSYNPSDAYVRAVRRFASRMAADERAFLSYYAWQVFVRTPDGERRLTATGHR